MPAPLISQADSEPLRAGIKADMAAEVAADRMQSCTVQLFHGHVLAKILEPPLYRAAFRLLAYSHYSPLFPSAHLPVTFSE